jgi:hypothetical protein
LNKNYYQCPRCGYKLNEDKATCQVCMCPKCNKVPISAFEKRVDCEFCDKYATDEIFTNDPDWTVKLCEACLKEFKVKYLALVNEGLERKRGRDQ